MGSYFDKEGGVHNTPSEASLANQIIENRNYGNANNSGGSTDNGGCFAATIIAVYAIVTFFFQVISKYYILAFILLILYHKYFQYRFSKRNIRYIAVWKVWLQKTIFIIPYFLLSFSFLGGVNGHYKYFKIKRDIIGTWVDQNNIYHLHLNDKVISFKDDNSKLETKGYYSIDHELSGVIKIRIYLSEDDKKNSILPIDEYILKEKDDMIMLTFKSKSWIIFKKLN